MPFATSKADFEKLIVEHVERICSRQRFKDKKRLRKALPIELGLLSHEIGRGRTEGFTHAIRFSFRQQAELAEHLILAYMLGRECCVQAQLIIALIDHGLNRRIFRSLVQDVKHH